MASDTPDPRTFQTWEDAFRYPIPVVRKLEQQLRINADDNREKLRSLVGTSYRSLLDTAETIIDMEVRMQKVESKLSRVGRSCTSKGLERISSNTVKMDTHGRSRDADRYTFASQLSVLRNAPLVMTRLMKREGSHLLIAKVLVVSRLVHKALGQNKNQPPVVDQLWEKLLSVRRKLLRRIDSRLANSAIEGSMLVESMSAYALATSSTPTDVLNHFLKVRLDRINSELRGDREQLAKHGVSALKLCIQTCLDSQTTFPRRLSEALVKLKAHPLIQDPEVRGLYELNLDIHDRWIGDEARNYTPWPRHDELQRPEAEKILGRWAKDAISVFLKGIKKALDGEERLKEVAELRQELIETWILSGSRMAGVKSANVLDDLRDIMNEKLEGIVRSRTVRLKGVVSELTEQLNKMSAGPSVASLSLWNASDRAANLIDGAQTFKSTIINTYQGQEKEVITVTSAFDSWTASVLEVKGIIKSMKEARWDDTFADDVEEESDDEFGDTKQTLLSDDDPKMLEEATQDALNAAMKNLGEVFSKIAISTVQNGADGAVARAIFVFRTVREIGVRLSQLRLQEKSTPPTSPFTSSTLQPLFNSIAESAVGSTVELYSTSLAKSLRANTNSHMLAEGNPPLPSQPSPSTFRFLRELNKSMTSLGSDLWAPGCVAVLKSKVSDASKDVYATQIELLLNTESAEAVDGKAAEEDGDDRGEDEDEEFKKPEASLPTVAAPELDDYRLKQLLFDALYVHRFVTDKAHDEDYLATLVKQSGLDEAAVNRLKKNAVDYAKKTYLLFALLA